MAGIPAYWAVLLSPSPVAVTGMVNIASTHVTVQLVSSGQSPRTQSQMK